MADIPVLKSVRDTYLYSQINKTGALDSNIKTLLTKGMVPTEKQLEQQISTINSYYKYPLKTMVLDALKEGNIKPMMFPAAITADNKVPTCMPFILTKGDIPVAPNAVAIIDNYATIDKELGIVNIDKAKFYTFLEGAYVARGIQITFRTLRNNTIMYTEAASVWAHMFTRLLNKRFALNINRTAYDKVMYLAAKFFMINLLQLKESDLIDKYASKIAKDINPIVMKRLNDKMYENGNPFENIATFIQALAASGYLIINGLQELTVREYTKDYINMYQNTALFALEHLSYFIFNIFSTVNGAFLNNQYSFKDVLGHSGEKVYGYVCNIVKNT